MKRIILASVAAALTGAAQAGSTTAGFQATVNFTSSCVVAAGPAPALNFGNYTAFGPAITATPTVLSLNCSRGTVITAFTFVTPATTNGLFPVNNLRYTISLTYAGAPTTVGTFATAGSPGSPDVNDFDIGGTLLSQAGKYTSALAVSETVTRFVKIDF